ncbi:MAG TPA: hypothetical protein VNS46_21330 [Nocardioides sp.]|nr:hypothetical protein [Nocardioides sp.]
MTDPTLLPWRHPDIAGFGVRPHRAPHRLHERPEFEDAALARLLDRLPREVVHPYTMGRDPARPEQWRRGAPTDLPGSVLLDLVAHGRLWLNVVGVNRHDAAVGRLVDELYAEIGALVPGFVPRAIKATLLISSPTALVYYHADNQPNILWHLRGRKRAYVYPRSDRFASQADLEKVVAGATDEELPYDRSYDEHADVLDLEPGQAAWWPQNSPHRVENLDGLNVSLSTEHWTADSLRREHVWTANHYLRTTARRIPRSTRERGVVPAAKVATMRLGRRTGLLSVGQRRAPEPSFSVAPAAPDGVGPLHG